MLAVGWEHAWGNGGRPASARLRACSSLERTGAHVVVAIVGDADGSLDLVLHVDRRFVGRLAVRPELSARFKSPIRVIMVPGLSSRLTVAVVWLKLGITLFDVDESSSDPFQESACFQLPPTSKPVSCCFVIESRLVVATDDPLLWVFDCHHSASLSARKGSSLQQGRRVPLPWPDPEPITSIAFDERLGVLSVICSSGSLLLDRMSPEEMGLWLDQIQIRPEIRPQVLSHPIGVSQVVFNKDQLIVGHCDGSLSYLTILFSDTSLVVSDLSSIPITDSRQEQQPGPVQHLSVSPNSSAFCVGWAHFGVAIFSSLTFTCMYSTVSTSRPSSSPQIPDHNGDLRTLHVHLENSRLMFASPVSMYDIGLVQFPSRPSTSLLGLDRVYIWTNDDRYQELVLPPSYPSVEQVCVSSSGRQVALSGPTGFCIFSQTTHKWKVFTTKDHYQALHWLGEYILVVAVGSTLLFYSSEAQANTPSMHTISVQDTIVSIDSHLFPGLLLISQQYARHSLYSIHLSMSTRAYPLDPDAEVPKKDRLHISIVHKHLADVVLEHPSIDVRLIWSYVSPDEQTMPSGATRAVSWIWTLVGVFDETPKLVPGLEIGLMQLTTSHDLLAHHVNVPGDQERSREPMLVRHHVQAFWIEPFFLCHDAPELYLWTYSYPDGAQVWVPSDWSSNLGLCLYERALSLFSMDRDLFPAAVVPRVARVIALGRGRTNRSPTSISQIHLKQQCYLPIVLLHQILDGRSDLSHQILARFSSGPLLMHTLELLLHHSMDTESAVEGPIGDSHSPTGLALEFLKNYPHYLQCVVRCARKTDFSHWGQLFPLAGTPHLLFEECLRQAELSTASHYLLVLQRTEGSLTAHQNAVRLLDALLARRPVDSSHIKIAIQLMRFIHMSKERNIINYDKGIELQRRASDNPTVHVARDRSSSASLPERRPSFGDSVKGDEVLDRSGSWVGGLVDWFTL